MPLPSCPHPAWVAAGLNHFMSDQPDFTRSKWHGATTGFTPYLPLSQPGRLFHRPATLDTRKTPVLVPNAFADRLVHDHNAKCPVMAEDGFKPASAWVGHGVAWLDDIQQFYRDRSLIEKEYSAKLSALAKRYFEKKNKKSSQLSVGDTPTMTPGSLE
ncbi:hypothetical protein E4U54_007103, partial [Claviceps lovelessii]